MYFDSKMGPQASLQQVFYIVNQTTFKGYIIYIKKKTHQSGPETEPLGEFKLNLTFESP